MVFIRKRKVFISSRKGNKTVMRSTSYRLMKTEEQQNKELQEEVNIPQPLELLAQFNAVAGTSDQQSPDTDNAKTKYETVKQQRLQDWNDLRDQLFKAYYEAENVDENKCAECEEEGQLYRCLDCSQWDILCEQCLLRRHQLPHLHLFEAWRNAAFVGVEMETPSWILSSHSPCDSSYFKDIVVVDIKGRQHKRNIQFCKCEPEAVTLVRYKLWPSTTKFPKLAFDMELLKWLYGLQIECQISTKGFCEALKFRCSKHHRSYVNFQVTDIYRSLVSETFAEFRHFINRTEFPHSYDENLDNGKQCPACFSTQPKIYSLDADFQLVRKASSGKQWEEPKHSNHFFLDQSSVDAFLKQYSGDKGKPDVDCNEFQAGSQLRSKNKNKKLSETALFGSTCRHEYPKYFFSLKHGERLGYAVFLIEKLLEERENTESQIHIMYDIACSLESHLKNRNCQSILQSVHFSIPIFHCYGHKMACQVLYNPRKTVGIGLTDGESLERLWSYLGRFSKITKEMSPENRVDLLTDGLIHYGQKIREKLGQSLLRKMEKAVSLEESSIEELSDLLHKLGGVSDQTVLTWIEEEKQITKNATTEEVVFTEKELYVMDLKKMDKLREKVIPSDIEKDEECQKLTNSIKKREKKIKKIDQSDPEYHQLMDSAVDKMRRSCLLKLQTYVAERNFLLELMKKYARGQSVAIRLGRQLKKTVNRIHHLIQEYNEVGRHESVISFNDIKDLSCTIWKNLNVKQTSTIPFEIKQQAINLKSLVCRASEEKGLLQQEMHSTLDWYASQHDLLKDAFYNVTASKRACIVKEGLYTETKLSYLHTCFSSIIEVVFTPPTFFYELVDINGENTNSWNVSLDPYDDIDSDLENVVEEFDEFDSDSDIEDLL